MAIDSRPFDNDPVTLQQRIFHYDEDTGEFWIETVQDVEPVLDVTKHERSGMRARSPWGKGPLGSLVARIPINIWWALERAGIASDDKALLKWIDHPDNFVFRSREGRLSRGR